jgi:hypothetical protein
MSETLSRANYLLDRLRELATAGTTPDVERHLTLAVASLEQALQAIAPTPAVPNESDTQQGPPAMDAQEAMAAPHAASEDDPAKGSHARGASEIADVGQGTTGSLQGTQATQVTQATQATRTHRRSQLDVFRIPRQLQPLQIPRHPRPTTRRASPPLLLLRPRSPR